MSNALTLEVIQSQLTRTQKLLVSEETVEVLSGSP